MPRLLLLTALAFEADIIARSLGTRPVVIGPGATLLSEFPVDWDHVALVGLSGALDPALQRGDVLFDEDSQWGLIGTPAKLTSAHQIIQSAADKQHLRLATAAAAVDMESALVKAWAAQNAIPYLGIRGISDRADEFLPAALLKPISPRGQLRPMKLVWEITKDPWLLPAVWKLRKSGDVMKSVARVLAEAIAGLESHTV